MLKRYFSIAVLAFAALATNSATAQITNYSEDFEGLDRTNPNALIDAGWQAAAAGIPVGGGFQFFAGFGAPNNLTGTQISIISDVASGGAPPVGNQGLVVFTDYSSDIHIIGAGRNTAFEDLIISVFQQRTISAADVGNTLEFSWIADGNGTPPSGETLTEAFLLILDPNNGFSASADLTFDTTATPDGALAANSITVDLADPLLDGQILQFGFRNTSSDSEGSAVDYDDVALTVSPIGGGFVLGDVSGDGLVNFLDIAPFIAVLSSGGFQDEADIDRDTSVSFLDISPFIALLNEQ